MGGRIQHAGGQPRVFLSYARADGQDFASTVRARLEAEHISLWQDRVGLEGGRDWWLQITDALDHVAFMVLVLTPAALHSPIVRKEWRYARQRGVCVYPVKGPFPLDFSSLPRWMRDVHWYDLDHEETTFLNDLQQTCERRYVPFIVEELPEGFVERPQEFDRLIGLLLDEKREEPVAITAALRGAGGYGKTTMVRAMCHDERVQEAFDDGILWVTLGENPGNLLAKLEDLIFMLSHERPGFSSMDAALTRFAEVLADRDLLLVIDDVWNAAHVKPFLRGGSRCARLITTRDTGVLPRAVQQIEVDAMHPDQAIQLLLGDMGAVSLSAAERQAVRQLSARFGEWPLLLTLVSSALHVRVSRGQHLADALSFLNRTLEKRGLTAFDAQDAQERSQAVEKTLRVSFDLLSTNASMRYRELAIFPEDVDIPLAAVQRLWEVTSGLDDRDTDEVCEQLYRFSLLLRFDRGTQTIRVHDVMRTYLRQEVGNELARLHGQFLDAYRCQQWASLSSDESYLWEYLALHLSEAGRREELVATVKDGKYLMLKVFLRDAYAAEMDIRHAIAMVATDPMLPLLKRCVRQVSHLLNTCTTSNEVAKVLHRVIFPLHDLSPICSSLERELSRPCLTSWHPFPSLRDNQLLRILRGHIGWVSGCAISPEGDYIVSASADRTLKIWDARSGAERRTLRGHTSGVSGCAISPEGDYIVSA